MLSSIRDIITESVTACNSDLQRTEVTNLLSNAPMKTNSEIRRENLLALIQEAGGESALAKRYECTPSFIKQMARSYTDSVSGSEKGIGDVTARKLETCMGKERGWLDRDNAITETAYKIAVVASETLNKDEQLELLHHLKFEAKKREHLNELRSQETVDQPATGPVARPQH